MLSAMATAGLELQRHERLLRRAGRDAGCLVWQRASWTPWRRCRCLAWAAASAAATGFSSRVSLTVGRRAAQILVVQERTLGVPAPRRDLPGSLRREVRGVQRRDQCLAHAGCRQGHAPLQPGCWHRPGAQVGSGVLVFCSWAALRFSVQESGKLPRRFTGHVWRATGGPCLCALLGGILLGRGTLHGVRPVALDSGFVRARLHLDRFLPFPLSRTRHWASRTRSGDPRLPRQVLWSSFCSTTTKSSPSLAARRSRYRFPWSALTQCGPSPTR